MGSSNTKIMIWNMALDLLREQPLASTADEKATAKWLGRNYDQQRDYLLERYYWKFAMARAEIAADATAPAWGWSYRYLVPTDALRIVPLTRDGAWSGQLVPFEQEGGYILCDFSGPLRLRYVTRITNEGTFSNGFCEVLAARLASKMAHWMTGKASMVQTLREIYTTTFDEVKDTEAVQTAADSYYDTDIAEQRSEFY